MEMMRCVVKLIYKKNIVCSGVCTNIGKYLLFPRVVGRYPLVMWVGGDHEKGQEKNEESVKEKQRKTRD
jgi:hypothetical protein